MFVFGWHSWSRPQLAQKLAPQTVYTLTLDMQFEQDAQSINITTFVPQTNSRQRVIKESVNVNAMAHSVSESKQGRVAQWSGSSAANAVQYSALVAVKGIEYQIDDNLKITSISDNSLKPFLQATEAIQVEHEEVSALWRLIKPARSNKVSAVLQSIFDYTYGEIEGAPFKGFTDAVTALRLKQASCNGKSRLFVALARGKGLPARLVGGIILNPGSKKTSHQWVEVLIAGHWIPFDPTNGHFASLPANYLTLYRTDQVLFRHTADINFDYLFSIDKRLLAPGLYPVGRALPQELSSETVSTEALANDINTFEQDQAEQVLVNEVPAEQISTQQSFIDTIDKSDTGRDINITRLLLSMGLKEQTIGLFLLFPLCTLLITFLRNLVGVKTFGIFMPMLIAAAAVFTGFIKGIIAFIVILAVSFIADVLLQRLHLLKIPRLAAIITLNTAFFIWGLSLLGTSSQIEFGMLSLFPVVIISFIAERIHQLSSDRQWRQLVLIALGTLVTIWLCYLILNSFFLQGLFSSFPEFYLLVLAGQIYVGKWTGLRLSELYRFKDILIDKRFPVMGINSRNNELINRLNPPRLLALAADKLKSKSILLRHGVKVPHTLLAISRLSQLNQLDKSLNKITSFALKPNQGSQGNGIVIITGKNGADFISAKGRLISMDKLKQHCAEIIAGNYSQIDDDDTAYFEPLIKQPPLLQEIAPYGLSDIRVILFHNRVVSAMLRVPTKASDGKANLHQGAIGISIDIKSGVTQSARLAGEAKTHHPDSNMPLIGVELPDWRHILEMSRSCQRAIPLGYMGVDICLDRDQGPLVLEVNGRPGIEIQNIQQQGFYHEFQS